MVGREKGEKERAEKRERWQKRLIQYDSLVLD